MRDTIVDWLITLNWILSKVYKTVNYGKNASQRDLVVASVNTVFNI
jgi:hypothetical protein